MTNTKTTNTSRFAAFLMLFVMVFAILSSTGSGSLIGGNTAYSPYASVLARSTSFIAPVVAGHAADNDGGNSDPMDVFDIVKSDGNDTSINQDNTVIKDANDTNPAGLVNRTQTIARIIFSICTVISLIFLVVNIAKLSASGSNDQARHKATIGILWSGIALALTGGMTIVVSFFWNFLTGL